ncbi:protein translocase subunit SecF [Smaragdicoccus niigatensis]|uniref:protein translocase subunit SecF n=1 Tax=Smaragdicoccus niigatensis TaxID=359359 RepID=UPI00035D46E5|nr:protein translocase subunit SecF [Smaragdicoccus niigatensis]
MTTEQDSTDLDSHTDLGTLPHHSFFNRLYTGTGAFEVVGNRVMWFRITGAIIAIAILSIVLRGFTFGIDFEGGTRIQLPADGATEQSVENLYSTTLGHEPVAVQTVGAGSSKTIQIRSEALNAEQSNKLQNALFTKFQPKDREGRVSADAISIADVSSTWGGQITQKALIALVVFLAIVAAYITFRFERFMAISALSALVFDLTVTAGVYSIIGFEVTPATVIGMLTILGYSLYDTVVVFDKVDENTRGIQHLTKRTYGEQANLALNQTLMRSINTTIIGIIPVVSMMIIAVWLLGVGTLKDLALVLLVGMIVGAYSSIFFATPLLVWMKERWGPVAVHTKKVLARRASSGTSKAAVASAPVPANVKKTAPSAPRPGARPAGKRNKNRH